jgi:type II secretion system protein N
MTDEFTTIAQVPQFPENTYGNTHGSSSPPDFGGHSPEPSADPYFGSAAVVEQTTFTPVPPSRFRKIASTVGWISFGVSSLLFFTILKLPEDRVKGIVQGNIAAALAAKGISFTAGKTAMSFFPMPSYAMSDISLTFPPPTSNTAHIDKIQLTPSLLSLLTGKLGGSIAIENGDGNLNLQASGRGSQLNVQYDANKLDIGKIGLLPGLAGIEGSAVVSGKGSLSLNTNAWNQADGQIQLSLSKIEIDSQSISGFTIPRLSISQGKVDLDINQGRGVLKLLSLGQNGSTTDDLKANFSGDLNFAKTLQASTINIKGNFSLSQAALKGLSIVEMILSSGKQADGSYSYKLTGPLTAPVPTPIGPNGG